MLSGNPAHHLTILSARKASSRCWRAFQIAAHVKPIQGRFMESVLLDAAGHRRWPATMPGYHRGRPPRNKGEEYPADPPTIEEIIAVMRTVGDRPEAHRFRALIVVLWRAGLRISEALALQESDLDSGRGAVLVRRGKGGKRREVGMDRWAWDQLDPWLEIRCGLRGRPALVRPAPATACPCSRDGTRGRPARGDPTAARARQPRHHQHLSARHRQLRDHQPRPRTAVADHLRHRRPSAEAIGGSSRVDPHPLADPTPHPRLATSRFFGPFGQTPAFPIRRNSRPLSGVLQPAGSEDVVLGLVVLVACDLPAGRQRAFPPRVPSAGSL
jgi:integrase